MNTKGLSISGLYLDGYTQYPEYNPADKRPVLGVFDIINFLISQAIQPTPRNRVVKIIRANETAEFDE